MARKNEGWEIERKPNKTVRQMRKRIVRLKNVFDRVVRIEF